MKITESIVVVLYFAVCVAIGLYYHKRSTNSMDEFYTAGGNVGLSANTLATFAAFASGGSTIGGVGFAYSFGVPFTWASVLGSIQGFILASFLVAPTLRKMKIRTISDFFKLRYQWKTITVVSGFIVLIAFTVYLVSQYKAGAITAQFLLGWDYKAALFLMALVYIIYVSIGGMWAITMTDAFQAAIMLIAMISLGIISVVQYGGIPSLLSNVLEAAPTWGKNNVPPISLIGFAFLWATTVVCMPHIVMRALSAKNIKVARQSFSFAALVYGLMVVIGFVGVSGAAMIMFPPGTDQALMDSDMALLGVMQELFPPVMQGVAAAGIMAAIMSTTASLLLAISAAISNDILGNLMPNATDKFLLTMGNVSIWVFGFLTAVLALDPPALLALLYSNAIGVLTAGFFWPLVLGVWWKKANKYGALASMLVGSGLYILIAGIEWMGLIKLPLFSTFLIVFPIAFIVNIIVSVTTSNSKRDNKGLELMDNIHTGKTYTNESSDISAASIQV
ncbi:sodium:solute symporter family protein [Bacillus sp. JJ1533]|uniref:sodium:solute symporter family protein n=1 Tax=Bacillus sp. JJ1533 TaxID=3122959 RepID=UPI002FFEAF78